MNQFKFTPNRDFDWVKTRYDVDGNVVEEKLMGSYYVGQTYNCTDKPVHDDLRAKCKEWNEAGRITIIALQPGQRLIMKKVV